MNIVSAVWGQEPRPLGEPVNGFSFFVVIGRADLRFGKVPEHVQGITVG